MEHLIPKAKVVACTSRNSTLVMDYPVEITMSKKNSSAIRCAVSVKAEETISTGVAAIIVQTEISTELLALMTMTQVVTSAQISKYAFPLVKELEN